MPTAWASSTMPRLKRSANTWRIAILASAGLPSYRPTNSWAGCRTPRSSRTSRPLIGRHSVYRLPKAPATLSFRPHRSTPFLPSWSTTPTTRSSASWGAAAWGWSTSPGTSSWGDGSAQGRRRADGRAARRARPVPPRGPVGRQAATQEYRHRVLGHRGSARASSSPWSTSTGTTWRRW